MTNAKPLATAGRVLIAGLFLFSGVGKLAAPDATIGYIAAAGLPLPTLAFAGAVALELIGAALLVIGYRVQLVAALLAGFSVVAAIGFHADFADQNQLIHFLKNIAIAGGLLQIVALDAARVAAAGQRSPAVLA